MKATPPSLLLVAILLNGCSDAPPPQPTAAETGPGDYLKNITQAQQHAAKTVDLAAINKAVETFYVQEGRFPKTLQELVDRDYLPFLPELPGGAKWKYDATNGIASISRE